MEKATGFKGRLYGWDDKEGTTVWDNDRWITFSEYCEKYGKPSVDTTVGLTATTCGVTYRGEQAPIPNSMPEDERDE